MMRQVFTALALALAVMVITPGQAAHASQPTEQELLVLKKKKAEAARKAAAAKLEAYKKAEAKKKADAKKKLEARGKATARNQQAQKRECGDLLDCLFGRRTASVSVTRNRTTATRAAVADRATAEVVSWSQAAKYTPGSIVVNTPERALYLVEGDGKARRYKVGVGREGFQWSGNAKIVGKTEWPSWRPPAAMIEREAAKGHYLPEMMEGGPDNPLGARALYIGGTLYRIHGTNNASSIGGAVSSGCIRMMNSDVIDLYDRVKVGARVYVYQ